MLHPFFCNLEVAPRGLSQNIKQTIACMKKCLLLLLLALSLLRSHAQDKIVRGKVTDESGKPLTGATVTIKGTNLTAATDNDGTFSINTGSVQKPVFTISYVGMESQDYTYKGSSAFTIQLHVDNRTLGDVIVVGYGVQRKRDVTGATAEVKAEQIVKKPIVRVEEALQGTVSGVTVQSVNGMPGQGLAVRIRGTASINNNNDPLYVIDGQIGGDISTISPNDIESMEVLKDASATAIYGSRGSTGVVIITTKLGKEGKPHIDINPWVKKEEIAKELPIMNAYQFGIATNAQNATTGQAAGLLRCAASGLPNDQQRHQLAKSPPGQTLGAELPGLRVRRLPGCEIHGLLQPSRPAGPDPEPMVPTDIARANLLVKASDRLSLQFQCHGRSAAQPQHPIPG